MKGWRVTGSIRPSPPRQLTFKHRDPNGSTVWADAVATNARVCARVGHLDVGDEQRADVGAVHASLEKTYQYVERSDTYLNLMADMHYN